MIDSSYEFFQLKKNLSSPLKLGRAACKPRGRGERKSIASKLTHRMKTIIGWLKHDRFKLCVFTLGKNLSYLLNLGAPPVSQEGEKRKIYWIIQTNVAYENWNWIAKTWSLQATRFFTLKKISLHLFNFGESPVSQGGEERGNLKSHPK